MPASSYRLPAIRLRGSLLLLILVVFLTMLEQDAGLAARNESVAEQPRVLAHLATDKPIYKAGDTLFARVVMTRDVDHTPFTRKAFVRFVVHQKRGEELGPELAHGAAKSENGSASWSWTVPEGTAGGPYVVRALFPSTGFPTAEREFEIRQYRPPRLRTQVEFLREGYAPGDIVTATLEVSRVEGGIPEGAGVTVGALVDQKRIHESTATVNTNGLVTASFRLPEMIERGEGTVTFTVEDGGVVETAAKTIPILLSHVDLSLYPEGGDLVAGVENRVYFEAIAPNGRPADVTLLVVDASGNVVAEASCEHEGRGVFEFVPESGANYVAEVTKPESVRTRVDLPVANGKVVLRAVDERVPAGEPLRLRLASTERQLMVTVRTREHTWASQLFMHRPEAPNDLWADLSLELSDAAAGVLRVTVYELAAGKHVPVAERLVYREPLQKVTISIEADKKAYTPGDSVELTVRTVDEKGTPIPAFVGLTVTDDGTLEMIETRKQAPRLPAMVYLEPEVHDLADAWIYQSDDPMAERATDLLLGTQGWRRFAFVSPDEFIAKHGEDARRVLCALLPPEEAELYFGAGVGGMHREQLRGAAVKANMLFDEGAVVQAVANEAQVDGEMRLEELKPAAAALPAVEAEEAAGEAGNDFVLADRAIVARREAAGYFVFNSSSVIVREYAHKARDNRQPNDRVDFAETVYWHAGLETDKNGEAKVQFDLSDSVTTFRAMADVWSEAGTFGMVDLEIESRRPFYVEIKAPLEVTAGDIVELPVVVVNETDRSLTAALAIGPDTDLKVAGYPETVDLAPRERRRVLVPLTVEGAGKPNCQVVVTASTGEFTDHVTRTIAVQPMGFPVKHHFSGLLENSVEHRITIPESFVHDSVEARAVLYPNPVANLTEALEALIADPHGCFEQTSSTNYPLVMAMQYFEDHPDEVDPAMVRMAREKLDAGYKRLVGFECPQEGYEWFGGDPGHEALTAYGLLEFHDMASFHEVDRGMLDRTRAWLLERRDGKGGFKRNEKALDSFGGAPPDVTNAYITWALASADEPDISGELDAALKKALASKDPYLVGVTAVALIEADRNGDATLLLQKLAGVQAKDGSVPGAETSITRSMGNALTVETTSFAILAWLSDGNYRGNVEEAVRWLASQCQSGRFGPTQSTVMALRALLAYDRLRSEIAEPGRVKLLVDGIEVQTVAYDPGDPGVVSFENFAAPLGWGEHRIRLERINGSPVPYSLTIGYHAETPESSPLCPLDISVVPSSEAIIEGDAVDMTVTVKNSTPDGLPMTLAIVGLPGGLEPRHEQLGELVKEGKIDFYEVLGRDVAIYFRDMAPDEERHFAISAIAAVPGTYTAPASRAYLYYGDADKIWLEGPRLTIAGKQP